MNHQATRLWWLAINFVRSFEASTRTLISPVTRARLNRVQSAASGHAERRSPISFGTSLYQMSWLVNENCHLVVFRSTLVSFSLRISLRTRSRCRKCGCSGAVASQMAGVTRYAIQPTCDPLSNNSYHILQVIYLTLGLRNRSIFICAYRFCCLSLNI